MTKSSFFTGRGDDGQTGLLSPGRVPKYDLRPEAYGAVDEAQAALGLVRASNCQPLTAEVVLGVQRFLPSLMAELAAAGQADSPWSGRTTAEQVDQVETWIAQIEGKIDLPREFVIPGGSAVGAALHLARTVVRRAERRVVRLADEGLLTNPHVVRYLNRLSSLLFVLAILEDGAASNSGGGQDQVPGLERIP